MSNPSTADSVAGFGALDSAPPLSDRGAVRLRTAFRAAALLVAVLACLAVMDTWRVFNNTWDEQAHLATGMELLDRGVYEYEPQHPPLARLAVAFGPWLDGLRSQGEPYMWGEGWALLDAAPDYWRTMALARAGVLPFFLLALGGAWVWARRLGGEGAGLAAVATLATIGPFLGHAGMAATDVAAAAGFIWAALAFVAWVDAPTARRAYLLGFACALAVLAKFSAAAFILLGAGIFFVLRGVLTGRPLPASLHACVVSAGRASLAFLFAAWVVYGARFDPLVPPEEASGALAGILSAPIYPFAFLRDLIEGVVQVAMHNRNGHPTFFLGEVGTHGWISFFPILLLIRTPLPTLILGALGAALLARRAAWSKDPRLLAPLAFALATLLVSMSANINIGVRHVFPIYPLLAVAVGVAAARLAAKARAGAAVVAALFAWQIGGAVAAHPDHLAWFNALAGDKPERFVVDSDLDWGQDLERLGQELRRRGVADIWLAYNGTAKPERHLPLGYRDLPPYEPQKGWIAISLFNLYANAGEPDAFAWLKEHEPADRVGASILLYHIE